MSFSKEEEILKRILTKNKILHNAPKMFKIGDQGRKIYYTAIIHNVTVDKNKEAPKSILIHIQEKLTDKREETLKEYLSVLKETYNYAKENGYSLLGLTYTDNEFRMNEAVTDMLQIIHKGEEKGPIVRVSTSSLATSLLLDEKYILPAKQQKKVVIADNMCLESDPIPPSFSTADNTPVEVATNTTATITTEEKKEGSGGWTCIVS